MKTTIVTTLACMLSAVSALAQGQINFGNLAPASGVNAPVYFGNGTIRLTGPNFHAELLAGPDAGSLTPRGTTVFLTGGGAGYFNGGVLTLAGIPGGATAFIQIRAWDTTVGATYDLAQATGLIDAYGSSSIFSVVTGNPNAVPPGTPANLAGLTGFNLTIPEPSTYMLAGLGISSLLLFRRRK